MFVNSQFLVSHFSYLTILIFRGVVPLRHVPPSIANFGTDWPLLFKVHEI